jgi:aminodeoxychorismate synthase component I
VVGLIPNPKSPIPTLSGSTAVPPAFDCGRQPAPLTDLRAALESEGTVLLDAAAPDPDSGRSVARLFRAPRSAIRADTADEVIPALEEMDVAVAGGSCVAGWAEYEAGYALERRLRPLAPAGRRPLLWFGVYDAPTEITPAQIADALGPPAIEGVREARLGLDPEAYARAIDALRDHIREGDIYQANLTAPLTFATDADPLALYARQRESQPAPYAAWIRAAGRRILSLSPELFFRIDGSTITTRPMKGTAPRDTPAGALSSDPKNRAENLMIVDLLRNDLARVAVPGTVRVPALFEVEGYPTVWQMTSTITATLPVGWALSSVFRALFPCGSVTGAPKIRAMEIIHGLETSPRGVYCGAIGFAGPEGAAFSVPIRTLDIARHDQAWTGTLGLGSGVVWDSVAEEEYRECLLKGRFLTDLAVPLAAA